MINISSFQIQNLSSDELKLINGGSEFADDVARVIGATVGFFAGAFMNWADRLNRLESQGFHRMPG